MASAASAAEGVLQVALGCIARWYRCESGRREGQTGSVTAIQRFGSALQLNLHFHVVHVDGVYDRGADGRLRFFHVSPSTEAIERLVEEVGVRCERWLARQGFSGDVDDAQPGHGTEEEDVLGLLQQASLTNRVISEGRTPVKAVKRARTVQVLGGKEVQLPPRCASYEGYNLHANVHFSAMDRAGLERLCRYFLRPPLALSRVERLTGADGRTLVRIEMKRTYSDGTHAIELSPQGLAEKLAAIIPPPRGNQTIYSGILAGNAAWRAEVVPRVATSTEGQRAARDARRLTRHGAENSGRRSERADQRLTWADLLQRVFRVDGWECPHCRKAMTLRTVVIGAPACTRILAGLERATGPPGPDRRREVQEA